MLLTYVMGTLLWDSILIFEKGETMGVQSLSKGTITAPREIPGFTLSRKKARRGNYKYFNQTNSVIFIRWISIFFCLAFWYGFYKLVKLFIA